MKDCLFQTLDIRKIPDTGLEFILTATSEECSKLSERFEVPKIKSLRVNGRIKGGDILKFSGEIKAKVVRKCVISMDLFEIHMDAFFKEFFSESGTDFMSEQNFNLDMEDETSVDLVRDGKLNIGEVVAEQFGLNLDPFPKKSGEYFEYVETEGAEKANPFAVLKGLTQE